MKQTKLFITLLLILLLTAAVSAQTNHEITITTSSATNDFAVFSVYESLSFCSCASGNDLVVITNTGSFAQTYQVSTNLAYATLSQSTFVLQPGEQQDVYVYINAPCEAKTADTMVVTVKALHGETKSLEKQLTFTNCQNLRVDFDEVVMATDVCTPFSTSFDVVNTGSFSDTFSVFVDEFTEYATLTEDTFTVAPLQKETVTVFYDLPCDVYGEQSLSYMITSAKTSREASFTQTLVIPQDYAFSLATVDEYSMCDSTQEEFLLTLTNNNHFAEEFRVGFAAPGFVDLLLPEQEEVKGLNVVRLEAGETMSFPVVLTPAKTDAGLYNLSFAAKSLSGDVTKELSMQVGVNNCFDFREHLNLPFNRLEVCGGDTSVYGFMLAHEGVSNPQVNLFVDGPEYVSLEPATVSFEGREIVPVNLVFDPVTNVNNRSKVTITSLWGNQTVGQDTFTLVSHTKDDCYGLNPVKEYVPVRFDAENVYITMRHTGLYAGTYLLDEVSLPDYLSLESGAISPSRGGKATYVLSVDREELIAHAQQYNNGSIAGVTATVSVEFARMDSPATFTHEVTVEFTKLPWYEIAWLESTGWIASLSLCAKVFLVLLVLAALALLRILCKLIIGFTWKTAKLQGLILLIIIVVAALALLLTQGFPTKDKFYTTYDLETNSTIYLRLAEDEPATYDLSQFFFDPDGNIVEYGVQLANDTPLDVRFRSDKMKIIPAQDYNGLTDMKLSATDAYGATAVSEDIFVHVLPVEDYTAKECFSMACSYWNFVLLVIVAALLFVGCSMNRKKTKRELRKEQEELAKQRAAQREVARLARQKENEKEERKRVREEKKAQAQAKKQAATVAKDTPVAKKSAPKSTKKAAPKTAKKASKKASKPKK